MLTGLGSAWLGLYGVYTLGVYTVVQRRKQTINTLHWFVIVRARLNWLLISDLHVNMGHIIKAAEN